MNCLQVDISTHSLTKRLTRATRRWLERLIFQLTASRRGWLSGDVFCFAQHIFQLTASRRGWRLFRFYPGQFRRISTHSLTKRLTVAKGWNNNFKCISTHSLTKRLTVYQRTSVRTVLHFNSQPHEEADCAYLNHMDHPLHFNSQPHEEADRTSDSWANQVRISTHSLTKRLTL